MSAFCGAFVGQKEVMPTLPIWKPQREIWHCHSRGHGEAYLQNCFLAPHLPGLLVYKNQKTSAEAQVLTRSY